MRHSSILVSIVALGALAACGPIPQPFAHQGGPERSNPLIKVPAGLAVRVDPPSGLKPGPAAAETRAALRRVRVAGVSGAPGDGDTALAGAIRRALLRHGARIVGAEGESDYQIVGQVDLTPPAAGRQDITIRWVVNGADGSELGDVVQRNAIRAGALDRPWGAVAGVIAAAAGPGIIEVMDKAEAAKSAARPGR